MVEINIFLDEDDIYEDMPMYEHIMRYLLHSQIKGATVLRGFEGFGSKRHLHTPRKFSAADEDPLLILFIDEEQKVDKVLPHIKKILDDVLITKKIVEVI